MSRIVVLVSGSGTLLQSLIDSTELSVEIVGVVSDKNNCMALDRAIKAGIPTVSLPLSAALNRTEWDAELTKIVASFTPDLVVCAGFMKLLGAIFLNEFAGRTINTHPALLPSFPGIQAPRDALAYGVKISGATVFMVDEGVDTGQILTQEAVKVKPNDTVESLHERIKVVERRLLIETIRCLCAAEE